MGATRILRSSVLRLGAHHKADQRRREDDQRDRPRRTFALHRPNPRLSAISTHGGADGGRPRVALVPLESSTVQLDPWSAGMSGRVPCKFFLHGACFKGYYCEFSHDCNDQPDNVCTFYQKRGACAFGSRCRNGHVEAHRNRSQPATTVARTSSNSSQLVISGSHCSEYKMDLCNQTQQIYESPTALSAHQPTYGKLIIMNMTLQRMLTAGCAIKQCIIKHLKILLICQFALLLLLALALMGKTVLRCMEIYAHSVKSSPCILTVLMKVVCMPSMLFAATEKRTGSVRMDQTTSSTPRGHRLHGLVRRFGLWRRCRLRNWSRRLPSVRAERGHGPRLAPDRPAADAVTLIGHSLKPAAADVPTLLRRDAGT